MNIVRLLLLSSIITLGDNTCVQEVHTDTLTNHWLLNSGEALLSDGMILVCEICSIDILGHCEAIFQFSLFGNGFYWTCCKLLEVI